MLPEPDDRAGWQVVADTLKILVEDALNDPLHPWTLRWPTFYEMVNQLGTSQKTLEKAIRHLRDEGVLVKGWVPRDTGRYKGWVPVLRALNLPSRRSVVELASEIASTAAREQWRALPTLITLEQRFDTNRNNVVAAIKELAARRQVRKLFAGGRWRWCVVLPHEAHGIDPRMTVSPDRLIVADLVRRIRSGEFRYRTPDGVVHDRPFLSVKETRQQYGASERYVTKARATLTDMGWIEPCTPGVQTRLSDRVRPVDLPDHPQVRGRITRRKPTNYRAGRIAEDLIRRIRANEFHAGLPTLERLMADYGAGRGNLRAALDELHRRGFVEFTYKGPARIAVLAASSSGAGPLSN